MEPSKPYLRSRTFLLDLLVGAVVIVALTLATKYGPRPNIGAAPQTMCDIQKAAEAVSAMIEGGILYKMTTADGAPVVYVKEGWERLPLDRKNLLDRVIRCRATGLKDGDVYVQYRDYLNDKKLAMGSVGGLLIE